MSFSQPQAKRFVCGVLNQSTVYFAVLLESVDFDNETCCNTQKSILALNLKASPPINAVISKP